MSTITTIMSKERVEPLALDEMCGNTDDDGRKDKRRGMSRCEMGFAGCARRSRFWVTSYRGSTFSRLFPWLVRFVFFLLGYDESCGESESIRHAEALALSRI